LGLESISEGLLDPISEITPIPTVAKDVAFEQRDPQIKVFLSNNCLRSFPIPLLNIEHLTVLSLRANQLVTLPPAISKLINLQELNIAQNHLRFLPGELLSLLHPGSKLATLTLYPNRFWAPQHTLRDSAGGGEEYESLTFGSRDETTMDSTGSGLIAYPISRTPVQFTDSAGNTFSRFALPDPESELPEDSTLERESFTSLATPKQLAPELRSHAATSKVINPKGAKSLFELALRACAASAQAKSIPSWLREDGWPEHFATTTQEAVDMHNQGGVRCSVCGRQTLLPLARWVEFRNIFPATFPRTDNDLLMTGTWVPFLRVGCSWRCVPVKVEPEAVRRKWL
jgi:hypothetical protein